MNLSAICTPTVYTPMTVQYMHHCRTASGLRLCLSSAYA